MEAPQTTESAQLTPEQLLKLLDLQMEGERKKRAGRSRNRATFLVVGILVILVGAGIALLVAQQIVTEMHDRGGAPAGEDIQEGRGNF